MNLGKTRIRTRISANCEVRAGLNREHAWRGVKHKHDSDPNSTFNGRFNGAVHASIASIMNSDTMGSRDAVQQQEDRNGVECEWSDCFHLQSKRLELSGKTSMRPSLLGSSQQTRVCAVAFRKPKATTGRHVLLISCAYQPMTSSKRYISEQRGCV